VKFYLAKTLELVGITTVGFDCLRPKPRGRPSRELNLLILGSAIFLVGRFMEDVAQARGRSERNNAEARSQLTNSAPRRRRGTGARRALLQREGRGPPTNALTPQAG
jgi:hypothetical protein